MLIQINHDSNIRGSEEFTRHVESIVDSTLGRFDDRITRLEVHLTDENSQKGGNDKRCAIEARPRGHQPLAASHVAGDIDLAVTGAAEKLARLLESTFGRLSDRKGRSPRRPLPGSEQPGV